MARGKPQITFVDFKVLTFGSDAELSATYGSLEEAERRWDQLREEFLDRWTLWGRPQAWWRFEPDIPSELRNGPALILTDADADEIRDLDMARRRYLLSRGIDPTPPQSRPFAN